METIECVDCGTWLETEPSNIYGVCNGCLPRRERDVVILPAEHPVFWDQKKDQDAVLRRAIETWGAAAQTEMAIEEMGECIVAIQKTKRAGGRELDPQAMEKLIDEIADAQVMMRQMAIIHGEDAVAHRVAYKIGRLDGRLRK